MSKAETWKGRRGLPDRFRLLPRSIVRFYLLSTDWVNYLLSFGPLSYWRACSQLEIIPAFRGVRVALVMTPFWMRLTKSFLASSCLQTAESGRLILRKS
jgi:hypothetical protein